jgi:hypothetical protein
MWGKFFTEYGTAALSAKGREIREPSWDPLRGDPRFKPIVTSLAPAAGTP